MSETEAYKTLDRVNNKMDDGEILIRPKSGCIEVRGYTGAKLETCDDWREVYKYLRGIEWGLDR